MSKIPQSTQMRDGSIAEDPRLGRLVQFDEESRKFNVADKLTFPVKGESWACGVYLDQTTTSACTGNSRAYDLAGSPRPLKQPNGKLIDEPFAQQLYNLAKKYDEWTGEDYEGSSVLGALKAAKSMGYIGEYRWAFNIDDMCQALATLGPVVVGTDWYNSMFDPQPNGVLEVDADSGVAGGHAYYFRAIYVSDSYKTRLVGKGNNRHGIPLLAVRNSWGRSWGHNGEAYIWADDYERVLMDGGEQSVVTSQFHR
jgi:hypothetical protein